MNALDRVIQKIDHWQRSKKGVAFSVAIVKKYGEERVSYQAVLLTYYGFLSIFPLLLVLTTIAGALAGRNQQLNDRIVTSMTNYFPVLGTQLSEHVDGLHTSNIAIIIGLLFTLYGVHGVAKVFRYGVRSIWRVSVVDTDGFPKSTLKSLGLVAIGGMGLLVASVTAAITAAAGNGLDFKLLSLAVNAFILFWLFMFLLNAVLPEHVAVREVRAAAIIAAVGLVVLQSLGGFLLARELRSLDALYSNFAIALGLLFWVYAQCQLLYYAVTIAAVRANHDWPRSLTGNQPTAADKRLLVG